jgi:hypothetical protein
MCSHGFSSGQLLDQGFQTHVITNITMMCCCLLSQKANTAAEMVSEVFSSMPWAIICTLGALVAALAGLLKVFVPPREEDLLR